MPLVAVGQLVFAATELYPIVEILDYPARLAPLEETRDATRAVAMEIWRARLKTMEAQLG